MAEGQNNRIFAGRDLRGGSATNDESRIASTSGIHKIRLHWFDRIRDSIVPIVDIEKARANINVISKYLVRSPSRLKILLPN